MTKFIVAVPSAEYSTFKVKAKSFKEAKQKVLLHITKQKQPDVNIQYSDNGEGFCENIDLWWNESN